MRGRKSGDAGYRSLYLSHAERALYHLSYTPMREIRSSRTQAVKGVDQKSTGLCPRRFESCRLRTPFRSGKTTPGGTRTHNLWLRKPTPYPLGYRGLVVWLAENIAEVGFDPTTCGLWAHRADHCATLLWQPWSNGQDSGPPSQRPGFDSRRLHFVQQRSPGLNGGGLPLLCYRMRPYSGESTPSRPIWEVKHRQAQLVLR